MATNGAMGAVSGWAEGAVELLGATQYGPPCGDFVHALVSAVNSGVAGGSSRRPCCRDALDPHARFERDERRHIPHLGKALGDDGLRGLIERRGKPLRHPIVESRGRRHRKSQRPASFKQVFPGHVIDASRGAEGDGHLRPEAVAPGVHDVVDGREATLPPIEVPEERMVLQVVVAIAHEQVEHEQAEERRAVFE